MVIMAVEYGNRIWQIEFLRNRTKIHKKICITYPFPISRPLVAFYFGLEVSSFYIFIKRYRKDIFMKNNNRILSCYIL